MSAAPEPLDVYDVDFYARHNIPNGTAYRLGLEAARLFHPSSAIDIGCATGNLLKGLLDAGLTWDVLAGVDHPDLIPRIRAAGWQADKVPLLEFALDRPFPHPPAFADGGWGLVACTETGEHIPAEHSEQLVDLIVRTVAPSGRILWSAAIEGQEGTGHVNCRPLEFWEDLFRARGFHGNDAETAELLVRAPPSSNEPWYQRVRVLRRS